jgi:hypothetical protein
MSSVYVWDMHYPAHLPSFYCFNICCRIRIIKPIILNVRDNVSQS